MNSVETEQASSERTETLVQRVDENGSRLVNEVLATEEPLEIQLGYGESSMSHVKPISVTMRTPGNDDELALGFLLSEGVIRDIDEVESTISANGVSHGCQGGLRRRSWATQNAVRIELSADVQPNVSALQRNFYTTSSCGVCGKASLLALRSACPPRFENHFKVQAAVLCELHAKLRAAQNVFRQTGGIHSAGLFDAEGNLLLIREDVGRHNAVDKLVGASMIADELPLRKRVLLLSGRASFELMQKALMAGIPMVAAVGAPSSLAVSIARDFDITLVGFLREDHFNIYHGSDRIQVTEERR